MSATVTYKGATLTTVSNGTKKLLTAGKYMEDDVTIVDVTQGPFPVALANGGYTFSSLNLTWQTSAEESI